MIDVTKPGHIRRVRLTDEDGDESKFDGPDPTEGPYQLRVEWDAEDSSLIEIADEKVTSRQAHAQIVLGVGQVICLTRKDARWLRDALTEVLALRGDK